MKKPPGGNSNMVTPARPELLQQRRAPRPRGPFSYMVTRNSGEYKRELLPPLVALVGEVLATAYKALAAVFSSSITSPISVVEGATASWGAPV